MKSEQGAIERRCITWFAATAGAVLFATGIAKVRGSFGEAKLLAMPDPIVGLSFGNSLFLAGLAMIGIALLCLSRQTYPRLKIVLVAWIATYFLVYRIGFWCIGWHQPCGSMGNLAGVLHLSDMTVNNITKGMLAYLLVGSYGLLFWHWWRRKQAKEPPGGDASGSGSGGG